MVKYVRARDSQRVGDQSFGFSPSLSLFLRFCLSFLFPFPSVTLSNSFLSLVSHSFSFSLYPSSFLHFSTTLSLFPTFFAFSFQLFSFLSPTFFCFLSLPLYSCSLPPCSFLLLSSSLSYSFCPLSRLLSLMSSRGHPCLRETRGSSSKSGQVIPGLVY